MVISALKTFWCTLILSLAMALSLLPATVLAANGPRIDPRLQQRLATIDPADEIPIIVRMRDPIALQSMAVPTRQPGQQRRQARAAMIRTLQARAEQSRQPLQAVLARHGIASARQLWLINGMAFKAAPDLIEELSRMPQVASLEYDQVIEVPTVTTAEVSSPAEPNIDLVNGPDLWALGHTGQGVTVAIMDSGVDVDHPDLGPRWRGGNNSWYDPNGEHPDLPTDRDGHGTGVAGIALGGDHGGTFIGVAPEAQWIGVKIFNDADEASNSAIHAGFQWLLDPDGDPDTDDAPDIVNNSWGFSTEPGVCDESSRVFQPDVQALKTAGIAVVFAAGNTGPSPDSNISPANYPESFAVGSVGTFVSPTLISDFSARGPSDCDGTIYPEVVAPGFHIWTSGLTAGGVFPNSYALVDGTSFSTSHVSGIMALLLSAFPGTSVDAIETAIKQSATDLGTIGADNTYGYGLVDSLAAFNYLSGQQGIAVTDSINPATDHLVAFGNLEVSLTAEASVSVSNDGSLPVQFEAVDAGHVSPPFLITSDGCSNLMLPAGESCNIEIRFAPTATGSFDGSLGIISNTVGSELVTVNLSGTGIIPHFLVPTETLLTATFNGEALVDSNLPGQTRLTVAGDELAVFDSDGVLCGLTQITIDGEFGPLVVYGDDPVTTEVDEGASDGETLSVRLWDSQWQMELPVRSLQLNGERQTLTWSDGGGGTVTLQGLTQDRIGVFRAGQNSSAAWYLDANGSGAWDAGIDDVASFGQSGDLPAVGDWNGDGFKQIGVFRNGAWYLDINGNGAWDADIDSVVSFGQSGDLPVVGDWNGDGMSQIGVFRNGTWYLDTNGSGTWNSGVDTVASFGMTGDIPVAGDWNGDGLSQIGVFRNGTWYLDADGNGTWNSGVDTVAAFGMTGDIPVSGDWNGDGLSDIGVFRNGTWYLDTNGSGTWNSGVDQVYPAYGLAGDQPLGGVWR
jgi:bacillopeptidase F